MLAFLAFASMVPRYSPKISSSVMGCVDSLQQVVKLLRDLEELLATFYHCPASFDAHAPNQRNDAVKQLGDAAPLEGTAKAGPALAGHGVGQPFQAIDSLFADVGLVLVRCDGSVGLVFGKTVVHCFHFANRSGS